ncbi:hypothetical protein [Leifsonia poae]|uniref:hypothetical protein n=1 Tax=Leifsonia poae TaxID=110933 RepID=UPI001CBCB287|nr:hypothetical protein [Leifsonia poae]
MRGSTGPLVAALAAGALALILLAACAAPASAAAPTPAAATLDVPNNATPPPATPTEPPQATTIDPFPSALVTTFPLRAAGTGIPDDVIQISAGAGGSAGSLCQATVSADGGWNCDLSAPPNGPAIVVRAVSRDTGQSADARVDVLSPPTIIAPPGAFTGGGVHGTAYPNARVTVTGASGATCSFPADSGGTWGCVLHGAPPGRTTVTATQVAPFSTLPSAPSAQVPIVIDTTPPAAPTITTPASGSTAGLGQTVDFAGAGETGSRVTVYASDTRGSSVICSALVQAGAWKCPGTLAAGTYAVTALQSDAAGNVSPPSNTVSLRFGTSSPAPGTAPGSPTPSAPPRSPSSTPAPAAPVPPGTGPTPTPRAPGSRCPSFPVGWGPRSRQRQRQWCPVRPSPDG